MSRSEKITKSQWAKIIQSMKQKWFTIHWGERAIKLKAYEAYLPGYSRGLSMFLNGKTNAVIIYSRRLRSMDSIIEVIKHEFIHLQLDDGKHGRDFKRLCLGFGLDPKKHA